MAFTAWALCGLYVPYSLGWQALDPLLLCGCALLGALFAGPMAVEGHPVRAAWLVGTCVSAAILASIPAVVSLLWSPPRLLLPPPATAAKSLVVAVFAAGAFAFAGAALARRRPGAGAAWGIRAAMAGTAALYAVSPGDAILGLMAATMPAACLVASLVRGRKGTEKGAGVIS